MVLHKRYMFINLRLQTLKQYKRWKYVPYNWKILNMYI